MTDQSVNSSLASEMQEEMLESLEQQLAALYEEKQQASADAAEMATMRETIANLEAQLIELYREKEELRRAA
jgi:predicted RNase H-like nuclease (RuvC/YqgF family)